MNTDENKKANLLAVLLVVLLCLGAGIPAILAFAPQSDSITSTDKGMSEGEVGHLLDEILDSRK